MNCRESEMAAPYVVATGGGVLFEMKRVSRGQVIVFLVLLSDF